MVVSMFFLVFSMNLTIFHCFCIDFQCFFHWFSNAFSIVFPLFFQCLSFAFLCLYACRLSLYAYRLSWACTRAGWRISVLRRGRTTEVVDCAWGRWQMAVAAIWQMAATAIWWLPFAVYMLRFLDFSMLFHWFSVVSQRLTTEIWPRRWAWGRSASGRSTSTGGRSANGRSTSSHCFSIHFSLLFPFIFQCFFHSFFNAFSIHFSMLFPFIFQCFSMVVGTMDPGPWWSIAPEVDGPQDHRPHLNAFPFILHCFSIDFSMLFHNIGRTVLRMWTYMHLYKSDCITGERQRAPLMMCTYIMMCTYRGRTVLGRAPASAVNDVHLYRSDCIWHYIGCLRHF